MLKTARYLDNFGGHILRFRKTLNRKSIVPNPQYQSFIKIKTEAETSTSLKLNVRIRSNNTFCSLSNLSTAKLIHTKSAGMCGIKQSQKNLKNTSQLVIKQFLEEAYPKINKANVFVCLSGPQKIRKRLLYQISKKLTNVNTSSYYIKPKKCFNGCRAKKKRRKKQKGLRIFK